MKKLVNLSAAAPALPPPPPSLSPGVGDSYLLFFFPFCATRPFSFIISFRFVLRSSLYYYFFRFAGVGLLWAKKETQIGPKNRISNRNDKIIENLPILTIQCPILNNFVRARILIRFN